MTNSNSSGGTTLVNPAGDAKRSLNEAMAASSAEEEKIEGLLINEEEQIMAHDEEITSEEETDRDAEERKMLTVALVKSVVETKQDSSGDEKRYGLRKRRRPTGEDLRLLEHNQSSKDGGLARKPQPPATTMVNDPLSPQADATDVHHPMETEIPQAKPSILLPDPSPNLDTKPEAPILAPAAAAAGQTHQPKAPVPATTSQLSSATVRVKPEPMKPPAAVLRKPPAKPAAKPQANRKLESPVNVPIIPASSTVPNPLSAIPIQPSTMSMHSSKAAHPDSTLKTVPCPLPAAAVEEKPELAPAAPPAESADKRKVTINEPVARPRAFSIDLDLGQFDISGDAAGDGDLPLGGGGRNRAFSFECFAFGINADEPLPPLGAHDTDSISTGRPRGDSIIFDPSSFQEGGIHEQNALEKARLNESRKEVEPAEPVPAADVPVTQAAAASVAPAPPVHPGETVKSNLVVPVRSNTAATVAVAPKPTHIQPPAPVTSYTTTTTTATHTTTTTTLLPSAAAAATTTTFSMDLLNKDGRIGIYLPEARKARIARFHEKRARRIWRKRIKYDCRKKLADSRPRIKGRFVKRSDMEDE